MDLSNEELSYIEEVARIRLDPDSRNRLRSQLAAIIEFVDRLQRVDTTGYENDMAGKDSGAGMRSDEFVASVDRDTILRQAPDSDKGMFRVPPVFGKDERFE